MKFLDLNDCMSLIICKFGILIGFLFDCFIFGCFGKL